MATCLLKGVRLLPFFLSFRYFLKLFFLQLFIRKSNYVLFYEGATLIQGAMFIQGSTFIRESRVVKMSLLGGWLKKAQNALT